MRDDEQQVTGAARRDIASAGMTNAKHRKPGSGVADSRVGGVPGPSSSGKSADGKRKSGWSFLIEMAVLFAIALTIALLIKTFVVQPFFIPSRSMQDTLKVGDKVLVNKLVYDFRPIARGDIIVFNGDGSWTPPAAAPPTSHNPLVRAYDATVVPLSHAIAGLFGAEPGQDDFIKRVIAIPGDHVVCCNAQGLITVNGVPLHESSYIVPGARPSAQRFNVVVPPGRLWVMGDNRPWSADSRYHDCAYAEPGVTCLPYDRTGTVPESAVVGRAFMIIWPLSRVRVLPIPATFNQAALKRSAALSSQIPGSRTAALTIAGDGVLPAVPSRPYLPLAGGVAGALPLTMLERRLRSRRAARRAARLQAKRQSRHGAPRD